MKLHYSSGYDRVIFDNEKEYKEFKDYISLTASNFGLQEWDTTEFRRKCGYIVWEREIPIVKAFMKIIES